tara:strand:+ start:28884 stop:30722 length:1839 start_codon:yes stop_codon:yes gene_type:complete
MKLDIKDGTTSKIIEVFIQDSSSTVGAGKTGLAWNTASLSAYYALAGAAGAATAITLATMTIGTWASGGFVEKDATNMPGVYQFGVPNAALTGANSSLIYLKGAADMAPNLSEVQLINDDLTDLTTQIGNIGAATGGALNFPSTSDNASAGIDPDTTTSVGSQTLTYTATAAADGSRHVIADVGNAIDWVYGFTIGGNRVGAALSIKGFVNAKNDDLIIYAYDHNLPGWENIGTLEGANSTGNVTTIIPLLSKHTGVSTELGNVYIRFAATGLSANADLNIDQVLIEAINLNQSIGYDQGAVHVDTLAGVAGTEAFVNGVADNPTNLWASAQTIAAAVGVNHYHVANGSEITLDANMDDTEISGDEYTIHFGGQSMANTSVTHGLIMDGTFTGYPHLLHTGVGPSGITGPGAKLGFCALRGSVVSNATTYQWVLHDCWGVDAANSEFDFGAAVAAAQTVYITSYHGPIKISNMDHADDKLYLSGNGNLVVSASSTTGTIYLSGQWTVTNSGTTTIVYDALTTDAAAILVDTVEIGVAGAGLTAILTTQMTESYAADGVAPTMAQSQFLIQQVLTEFAIAGTVFTAKKLDGTTTAFTLALDSAANPTSLARNG